MRPPLTLNRWRALAHEHGSAAAALQPLLDAADTTAAAHVFTALFDAQALAAAGAADARTARGESLGPLDGAPVTVKDLYDIAGRTTRAGSVVREGEPPATHDAAAVARLRAAGAAITGLTNMTEFAFSGVGLNPHFGTPVNPCDAAVARIPGGSSAGAAVSVALGLAVAGLGSDTGGSIRIPAALCGLVGFKNTQARTPLAGAFPLSHTLDTVCAMANSVADCLVVDGVLAGAPLQPPARTLAGARLLVPTTLMLEALEPPVAAAFERALSRLAAAGAVLVHAPLPEVAEIAGINAPGGLSAIEAFATHRGHLHAHRERFDPRVAQRIALGEGVSAADYLTILRRRRGWIERVRARLGGLDALVAPTVPITAPPIAVLQASDEAFFKTNALLLRNTFPINFLDGCAFTLPCHERGALPVGLMLAAPGGHDAALAALALAAEPVLAPAAG
jgi:aspartyl-tRNA(Asn)/glutamyl-tRNA(Gln) amidotransferase subunit A